jgi:hypothetical protein
MNTAGHFCLAENTVLETSAAPRCIIQAFEVSELAWRGAG